MNVCIEIGNHAITSDSRCWSISKKVKTKDGDIWSGFMFYNSFDSAMMGLYNLKLRTCDAKSVLELRDAMNSISAKIIDTCTPLRAENALNIKGE